MAVTCATLSASDCAAVVVLVRQRLATQPWTVTRVDVHSGVLCPQMWELSLAMCLPPRAPSYYVIATLAGTTQVAFLEVTLPSPQTGRPNIDVEVASIAVPRVAPPLPTSALVSPSLVDDAGTFGASGLWATRGSHLYLSTDYGATWVQRSLVPGVALDVYAGDVLSSVFVLDASHAWSASPGPGSTPYTGEGPLYDHLYIVVSGTSDGGRTWHSVTPPGDWAGTRPVLAFADARHGFLQVAYLRFGGPGAVFATDDGGATWRQVSGAEWLGAVFGATDVQTLWAGNQGDAGPVTRPILDVSRDSGRTWTDARLPGLVGDIYVNDTLGAPPVISGLDGAVAVSALSSANPAAVLIFRTTDDGRSWVRVASLAQNNEDSVSVAVIDATHFVAVDPAVLTVQSTADGGTTWHVAPTVGLNGAGLLHFWDPMHGVAIGQLSDGPAPAAGLSRTADGGRTWAPVLLPTTP